MDEIISPNNTPEDAPEEPKRSFSVWYFITWILVLGLIGAFSFKYYHQPSSDRYSYSQQPGKSIPATQRVMPDKILYYTNKKVKDDWSLGYEQIYYSNTVYSADIDGSNQKKLLEFEPATGNGVSVFQKFGDKNFLIYRYKDDQDLVLMDLDGNVMTNPYQVQGYDLLGASFSMDGTKFVMAGLGQFLVFDTNAMAKYTFPIPKEVGMSDVVANFLDNDHVVLAWGDAGAYSEWLVKLDYANQTATLADQRNQSLYLSADYYLQTEGAPNTEGFGIKAPSSLYLINIKTGAKTLLAHSEDSVIYERPIWSSDRKKVLFSTDTLKFYVGDFTAGLPSNLKAITIDKPLQYPAYFFESDNLHVIAEPSSMINQAKDIYQIDLKTGQSQALIHLDTEFSGNIIGVYKQ